MVANWGILSLKADKELFTNMILKHVVDRDADVTTAMGGYPRPNIQRITFQKRFVNMNWIENLALEKILLSHASQT